MGAVFRIFRRPARSGADTARTVSARATLASIRKIPRSALDRADTRVVAACGAMEAQVWARAHGPALHDGGTRTRRESGRKISQRAHGRDGRCTPRRVGVLA